MVIVLMGSASQNSNNSVKALSIGSANEASTKVVKGNNPFIDIGSFDKIHVDVFMIALASQNPLSNS